MRRATAALLAILIGSQPAVHGARQGTTASAPPPAGQAASQAAPPAGQQTSQPAKTAPPAAPSVEAMGLSFDRIRRQVSQPAPARDRTGLKLEYYVDVVGVAPPFQLFAPDEPSFGRVPGGAPTHAEMMRHITPQAFSAPAATLVSLGAKRGSSKVLGQDIWQTQSRMAREVERRKKIEAERERQRKLKETVVVSPPKEPAT